MKVNRVELLKRLTVLKPAVKTGGLIPELAHIWFKDQEVFAFDGELGIRTPLDSGLECGVPGGKLLDLLTWSRLSTAALDPDDSGAAVMVKIGRSENTLAALDLERGVWPFPVKDKGKDASRVELTEGLLEALKWALMVEVRVVARVEHRGVLVYCGKKETILCATDSATIALARVPQALDVEGVTVLPRPFAEQVVSLGAAGDSLVLYKDHLTAHTVDATIYSLTVDADGVRDVRTTVSGVESAHPDPVPIPPGLSYALRRAIILGDKDDVTVDVWITDGELRVSGKYGENKLDDRMSLKGAHPEARGTFTVSLLARGVEKSKTMSLSERALLLRDGNNLYAVAPREAVK